MTDIKVCTDDSFGQPADIIVCDESQTPIPSDIKICIDDGRIDNCPKASDIIFSGTDAPSNGSTYTATGGLPPYSFSVSSEAGSPSVSSSGNVLTIDDVGTADGYGEICVTDSCGTQVCIEVRWPLGQWCYVSFCSCSVSGSCTSITTCTVISGLAKRESQYRCCNTTTCTAGADEPCKTCSAPMPYLNMVNRKYYEWRYSGFTCNPIQTDLGYPC